MRWRNLSSLSPLLRAATMAIAACRASSCEAGGNGQNRTQWSSEPVRPIAALGINTATRGRGRVASVGFDHLQIVG